MAAVFTLSLNRSCFLFAVGFTLSTSLWGCGTDEAVSTVGPQLLDGGDGADNGGNGGSGNDPGSGNAGAGAGAGANNGGSPPIPSGASSVGRPCLGDSDCPGGLSCVTSESGDFLGGGPANGYCTAPCGTDLDCLAFDAQAICLGLSEATSYCIQSCTPGALGLGQVKCQGRIDVGCDTVGDENGSFSFCRPVCLSDADCCSEESGDDCSSRENIHCDLGAGVCVSELPEGKEIGEDCDPEAETNDCASGLCLPFAEGYAICSALCTVGTVGCGSDSLTPSDPGEPLCLNVFQEDVGDVGRCSQRCDCDGDCRHSDGVCWGGPFGEDPDGTQLFGTQGLCVNSGFADTALPEDRVGIQCIGRDGGAAMTPVDGGSLSDDSGAPAMDSGPMSMPSDAAPAPEPEPTADAASEAGSSSSDGG